LIVEVFVLVRDEVRRASDQALVPGARRVEIGDG
jgi:hypothetical protein